jgi:hypothetical protein
MPKTKEEEEAERLAAEEEANKKAAEETSEEEDPEDELTLDEYKARLKETRDNLRKANKEAKDRRLALEALEKEKKEREEKELSEAQKAQKRAEEAEAEKLRLEAENRELKLRDKFRSKSQELKISFANEKAEEDAFNQLDPEEVGDDFSGLESAIKTIVKDRPYLLGKQTETPIINDGSLKGKVTKNSLTQEAIAKKRGSIAPL